MTPKRILIVEPDAPFALSVASFFREEGHGTAVAVSAGEAELEIASRRPDLVVLRAELPDLSGFSLCARLRHDRTMARLPVILYSSDTPPASLAEHARTPWAASGYLAMPLDTAALTTMARRLLAAQEPVELADDAIVEDIESAASPGPTPPPPPPGPALLPPPLGSVPPRLPSRPRRDVLTEEDRLFAARAFQSIGGRRDELAAEAERRRPPPRRDLLASPEGRLTLLREDLKWREAQLARLGEIWETRERETASVDERVHAKEVEAQAACAEADDLRRRLEQAHARLEEKEREHGASLEGLLLEKFKDEKDLIEVVAGTERRVHEQARELRSRDEQLASLQGELATAAGRLSSLEAAGREARSQVAALEGQVEGLERALREAADRIAAQAEEVEARDALLHSARREVERLQGGLSAARQALMLRETELRGEVSRARSDAGELASILARTTQERDEAQNRSSGLDVDLAAARAEGLALGAELEAARSREEASRSALTPAATADLALVPGPVGLPGDPPASAAAPPPAQEAPPSGPLEGVVADAGMGPGAGSGGGAAKAGQPAPAPATGPASSS
jgi:ParB family chromosome partitioning protein